MRARDVGRRLLVGLTVLILLAGCGTSATPTPMAATPTPMAATPTPPSMPSSTATPSPSQAVAATPSPSQAVAATPGLTPSLSPAASPSASAAAGIGSVVDVTAVSLSRAAGVGFAVDAAGDIYTPTGTDGSALAKLAPDGTVLAHWAGTEVIAGEPDLISDVALDPASGDVFAVDATADRVVHLSPGLRVLGTFGATGDGPGQFTAPSAIAFDPSGHVLVVDTGNNRIETFSRDGTLVSTWNAPGGAMLPYGLAVDARGDLVVSGFQPMDFSNSPMTFGQVIVFSPDQKPLLTLKESGSQQFTGPNATVDPAGDILVQDNSGEIFTFSPTGTLVTQRTVWSGGSPGWVRVVPSGQVYASGCVGTDCKIVEVGPTGEALRTWGSTRAADYPGSKVATGRGYSLYLQCAGTGSPTIVWEAGSGGAGSSDLPGYLLGRLAKITRVCLYDRAGLGLSDTAPYAADFGGSQMIADLHAVLHAAAIPGPYVMVGASLGGPLNRLFAATYPKEVVGMVQVDGSTEASLTYRGCTDASCDAYSVITALQDAIHGKVPGSLGALPLVVLSHDPALPFLGTADANWEEAQQVLATASSNAVHVDATWSSHLIGAAAPGLVIEAVREVVAAARAADHALPRCGAAFTKLGGKCL